MVMTSMIPQHDCVCAWVGASTNGSTGIRLQCWCPSLRCFVLRPAAVMDGLCSCCAVLHFVYSSCVLQE